MAWTHGNNDSKVPVIREELQSLGKAEVDWREVLKLPWGRRGQGLGCLAASRDQSCALPSEHILRAVAMCVAQEAQMWVVKYLPMLEMFSLLKNSFSREMTRMIQTVGWKWKWSHSVVFNSAILWTAAYQVPPSMEFSRQEYWSGLPFPSPGKCILWEWVWWKWKWDSRVSPLYSGLTSELRPSYNPGEVEAVPKMRSRVNFPPQAGRNLGRMFYFQQSINIF